MAPLLTLYSQVLKPLRTLGTLSGVPGSLPPRSLPPASSMSTSNDAWDSGHGSCAGPWSGVAKTRPPVLYAHAQRARRFSAATGLWCKVLAS